ncbi:MAG: pro-sigmaK processing inhibitor BofA family protein [Oscillospiraceae bacterium]|nr:pro-sigmaK processing inhibitor BofA family protein [Oscillospiraceae bacterium]
MLFFIAFALFCASALVLDVRALSRAAHPGLSAAKSALGGVAAVLAVDSLAAFTGVRVGVNYATVAVAALGGLPGAVLLLAVRLMAG